MRTRRSGESALLLLDVVDLLSDQNIDYAVVGALAASIHGTMRASMDADMVLSVGLPQAEQINQKLKGAGFQTDLNRGDLDDPIAALLKATDQYGNEVDVLIGLRGLDPQAFSRAISVPFQGKTLRFIGREDFVAMKVFAGGPVDLVDATRAITAGGPSLDHELVRRLAKRFGRDALESAERLLKDHERIMSSVKVICEAIGRRTLLEFRYNKRLRVVAPYCCGVSVRGADVLRAIQVRGESASGGLGFGKLWSIDQIAGLQVLDEVFTPDDPDYNPGDRAMVKIYCGI
jgi:hypothetical protein